MPKRNVPKRKAGSRSAKQEARLLFPGQEAVERYAEILANPFVSGLQIGAPIAPAIPSEKETVKAYGTTVTNASGFGFCLCNASPIASTGTNIANLYTTDQTYSPSYFSTVIPTTGLTPVAHNGSLASTDYSTGQAETRVVACGLRIRYIGREDAMSGKFVLVRSPYGQTMNGASFDLSHVREWEAVDSIPVDREWATVVWTPHHTKDTAYTDASGYVIQQGDHSIGVMIVGGGATSSYEVEYILHYEKIGNRARGVSINPTVDEHAKGIVSHVANHKTGIMSRLANKFGPSVLKVGRKLVNDYWQANRGSLSRRALSFAGRAAPLALL